MEPRWYVLLTNYDVPELIGPFPSQDAAADWAIRNDDDCMIFNQDSATSPEAWEAQ